MLYINFKSYVMHSITTHITKGTSCVLELRLYNIINTIVILERYNRWDVIVGISLCNDVNSIREYCLYKKQVATAHTPFQRRHVTYITKQISTSVT